MPIDSKHPKYSTESADFTTDAYNGDVKQYIPRLRGQDHSDYKAYVTRPSYYNVTKRTTDALIGAMLRKPHTTNLNDINVSDGMTFDTFLNHALRDVMLTSRVGILVDYDMEQSTPQLIPYDNNSIINWGDDFIILQESFYDTDPDDKYKKVAKLQYRELTLEQGIYTVNVWRLSGRKDWKIVESYVPSVRGVPLDFIPFVFINSDDTTCDCSQPTMYDLAEINVSHLRSSADLEQCAHFMALPQPYIAGNFQSAVTSMCIGSPEVWMLEPGSSVGYLQYSGVGFKDLMSMIDKKEAQMTSLGGRLLNTTKAGVESAEALRIRSTGEGATLISLINSLEQGIKIALEYYTLWMGDNATLVEFYMNRDFTSMMVTPQETDALLRLFQAGQISQETLLQRLYEGEIVDNVVDEKERLLVQA